MNSDKITTIAVTTLTLIIGVSALAVFVSKSSNTSSVLTSTGAAFAKILGTAVSPVSGGGSSLASGLGSAFSFLN